MVKFGKILSILVNFGHSFVNISHVTNNLILFFGISKFCVAIYLNLSFIIDVFTSQTAIFLSINGARLTENGVKAEALGLTH